MPEETAPSIALRTHPVAIAIDAMIAQARDIQDCDDHFVPLALEQEQSLFAEAANQFSETTKVVTTVEGSLGEGAAVRTLLDSMRRVDRAIRRDRAVVLRRSLFLGLFSAFDTFTGDLISALFGLKPQLFSSLGVSIPVGDVLACRSIDELKASILYDYVETFRRKSYIEQFETLEKLFDLKLRLFKRWPDYVEATQRRNLIAHCGGVVSEQYTAICARESVDLDGVEIGARLNLTTGYISSVCRLVAEVALMLGQTLWRKVRPDELALADKHLHSVAYDALQFEEWEWSAIVSDFALNQRVTANEQSKLIALINLAIALKSSGVGQRGATLLNEVDWSAKRLEFKLAVAVLRDDFSSAADLMLQIGKKTDLLEESSYHDWPLFREFRGTPEFLRAFEDVYGRSFTREVQKEAEKTEAAVTAAGAAASGESSPAADSDPPLLD